MRELQGSIAILISVNVMREQCTILLISDPVFDLESSSTYVH